MSESHYRGPWQATLALAPLALPKDLERTLTRAAGRTPYDWPHVTLVQLPDETRLERVRTDLAAALKGREAVTLEIAGVRAFAGQSVVYLQLQKTPGLLALQRQAARVVGDAAADIYTKGRWLPHISIFYEVAEPEKLAARFETASLEFTLSADSVVLRDWRGPDTVYPLAGVEEGSAC